MIGIGLIGCSGHYALVLQGLAANEDLRLVAVAPGCPEEDLSPLLSDRTVTAARPAVYDDYRDMLARERLDVVGVNPPFYLHAAVCREALRHGTAPYCEKPLALDLQALESLALSQKEAALPVGMMLNYRYEPAFYTARKLVAAGAIGEVAAGYAQKSYKLGRRPAFFARRETWGGLIPWVGIHALDCFAWVSGRRYKAAWAKQANLFTPAYPGLEDSATCLLELDNGGSVVMSFDYLRPASAATHGDDRLRLVGSRGVLEIRQPGALDVIEPGGLTQPVLENSPGEPFTDFVRSVMNREDSCLVTTEDAFAVTEVALRVREAADKGIKVAL